MKKILLVILFCLPVLVVGCGAKPKMGGAQKATNITVEMEIDGDNNMVVLPNLDGLKGGNIGDTEQRQEANTENDIKPKLDSLPVPLL